jgi:antitoxin MazE
VITEAKMKARIVRIGNSRGIRIPKPLLDQADLGDEVELTVVGHTIVIAPATTAREGWGDAFRRLAAVGDDALLDELQPTEFDREAWRW